MTVHQDKKRGTWLYQFDGPRHPDGRRNQQLRRGFVDRDEALLAEAKRRVELFGARPITSTKDSFGTYLVERWLPALKGDPKRKPSTIAGYESMVPHLVRGVGDIRLRALAGDHLTALYGRLRAGGLAERTVRYVHTTAHLALKDAVRWRLLGFNPADDADAPAQTPPRPKAWTPEQVNEFLAAAAEDRWWPLWRTAVTTGLRRGELAGLRWEDVDLARGELVVEENRVVVDHEVVTGTPKGNRARRLGLDPVTVDVLKVWKRQQAEERLVMGPGWPETGLVFVWPDGSPVHPNVISRTYKRIRDGLELPPLRLHNVRHAWATSALLAGVPVKVVSARLGHSSTRVTEDIYTAAVPSLDAAAAATVADLYDRSSTR